MIVQADMVRDHSPKRVPRRVQIFQGNRVGGISGVLVER